MKLTLLDPAFGPGVVKYSIRVEARGQEPQTFEVVRDADSDALSTKAPEPIATLLRRLVREHLRSIRVDVGCW